MALVLVAEDKGSRENGGKSGHDSHLLIAIATGFSAVIAGPNARASP